MIPVGIFFRLFPFYERRNGNEKGEAVTMAVIIQRFRRLGPTLQRSVFHSTKGEIRPSTLALSPKVTPDANPMLRAK